jgi:hypothetical protein
MPLSQSLHGLQYASFVLNQTPAALPVHAESLFVGGEFSFRWRLGRIFHFHQNHKSAKANAQIRESAANAVSANNGASRSLKGGSNICMVPILTVGAAWTHQ